MDLKRGPVGFHCSVLYKVLGEGDYGVFGFACELRGHVSINFVIHFVLRSFTHLDGKTRDVT